MPRNTAKSEDPAELAKRSIGSIPDHVFGYIINGLVAAFALMVALGLAGLAWHMGAI